MRDIKRRCFHNSLLSRDLLFILEAIIYVAIASILVGIALHYYSHYLRLTTHSSVISAINPIKTDIYYHYAHTGEWMSAADLSAFANFDENTRLQINADVKVDKGNIIIRYPNDHHYFPGQVLVLRKATFPQHLGAPTIWLCGFQTKPAHAHVTSVTLNTVLPEDLPKGCKP